MIKIETRAPNKGRSIHTCRVYLLDIFEYVLGFRKVNHKSKGGDQAIFRFGSGFLGGGAGGTPVFPYSCAHTWAHTHTHTSRSIYICSSF